MIKFHKWTHKRRLKYHIQHLISTLRLSAYKAELNLKWRGNCPTVDPAYESKLITAEMQKGIQRPRLGSPSFEDVFSSLRNLPKGLPLSDPPRCLLI
jgi:hypothetical protein